VDNITHTLTGLMLSRAGFDRRVGRCAVIMTIAANLPDVDGISLLWGPALYLQWHRTYTHWLISVPLMAMIPLLLLWVIKRQPITAWSYAASFIAALSHPLLDWTNVYGIRMLMPFSKIYFRLDLADLFDPWILSILGIAVIAPWIAGLVGSEIASSRTRSSPRRPWAWFALLAFFAYDAGRYIAHERASAEMNSHLVNGVIPKKVTVLPSGASPLSWRGIAEGETPESGHFITIVPIDLSESYDPTAGRIDYSALPVAGTNPAIEAARATEPFRVFAEFDQVPFWKTTASADGILVELIDLRFGSPQHPGFEASATVDASGSAHDAKVKFR